MSSVIVLEGFNGVGKSTLAKALSDKLGVPLLRAFRHAKTDDHLDSGEGLQDQVRALGVPVNTFVDDLYMADFLGATRSGAVLDRSMPSAIAYGYMKGDLKLDKASLLLEVWQTLLVKGARVLYVQMSAPYDVTKERCSGRWHPNKKQHAALDKAFTLSFRTIRFPKLAINTDGAKLADGVERICRALKS